MLTGGLFTFGLFGRDLLTPCLIKNRVEMVGYALDSVLWCVGNTFIRWGTTCGSDTNLLQSKFSIDIFCYSDVKCLRAAGSIFLTGTPKWIYIYIRLNHIKDNVLYQMLALSTYAEIVNPFTNHYGTFRYLLTFGIWNLWCIFSSQHYNI